MNSLLDDDDNDDDDDDIDDDNDDDAENKIASPLRSPTTYHVECFICIIANLHNKPWQLVLLFTFCR